MRAHHALRASLPGVPAGAGWRRVLAVAGLTVLAFTAPAVAAYAADAAVSGPGNATTATTAAPSNETLVVRAGAPSDLYPGVRRNLSLLVTNQGDESVTTIAATHVDTVVTNAAGVCGKSDFTVTARTPVTTVIPAGETRTVELPDAVGMNASAGDGCQGADLRFVMTVTAF
jgi:hypothetical protein